MPRLNGTGPMGTGSGTGRGRGPCGAGSDRGFRGWLGRGLGRFGGPWASKNDKASLDEEEKMLKGQLEQVRKEKEAFKDQK